MKNLEQLGLTPDNNGSNEETVGVFTSAPEETYITPVTNPPVSIFTNPDAGFIDTDQPIPIEQLIVTPVPVKGAVKGAPETIDEPSTGGIKTAPETSTTMPVKQPEVVATVTETPVDGNAGATSVAPKTAAPKNWVKPTVIIGLLLVGGYVAYRYFKK